MSQLPVRQAHLWVRVGGRWVCNTFSTDDPIWPETLRAALTAGGNVRISYGNQPEPQPSAPRP